MQATEIRKIAKWATFACEQLKAEKLLPLIQFQQSRAVSFGGMAVYKGGEYILKISVPMWEARTEDKRRITVIHEICHLVNLWRGQYHVNHGWEWQTLMHQCGISNPSVTCSADGSKIGLIPFKCNCPEMSYMGKGQYRKFLNGKSYHCKRCKVDVRPYNVSPRILKGI